MLFDVATSAIAGNKIRLAMRVGSPLLPGWVTDKEGTPIMEEKPSSTARSSTRPRSAEPGSRARTRATASPSWPRCWRPCWPAPCPRCCRPGSGSKNHFAAYSIEAFTDVDRSRTRWTRCSRPCAPPRRRRARSACSIRGCPRHEEVEERRANGIPLHKEVIQWFASARPRWAFHPWPSCAEPPGRTQQRHGILEAHGGRARPGGDSPALRPRHAAGDPAARLRAHRHREARDAGAGGPRRRGARRPGPAGRHPTARRAGARQALGLHPDLRHHPAGAERPVPARR